MEVWTRVVVLGEGGALGTRWVVIGLVYRCSVLQGLAG